jgi:hypothetical protein
MGNVMKKKKFCSVMLAAAVVMTAVGFGARAAAADETPEQATATELENFKKAFSVCLEAKDYLAKY